MFPSHSTGPAAPSGWSAGIRGGGRGVAPCPWEGQDARTFLLESRKVILPAVPDLARYFAVSEHDARGYIPTRAFVDGPPPPPNPRPRGDGLFLREGREGVQPLARSSPLPPSRASRIRCGG